MLKNFVFGLGIAAGFVFANSAHAQEQLQLYGGLEIMNAFEDFDSGGVDFDDSIALGAQLGLRALGDNESVAFGAEAKFVWYDSFDFAVPGVSGEVEAWSVSLRPKLWFPLGERFKVEPYVYGGFGWADADASANSFLGSGSASASDWFWEVGGGVEIPVIERLTVFVEAGYVNPLGDLDGAELWTIGVGINFRLPID